MAQAPIGIGPNKLVQSITLGPTAHTYGDSTYCSAWLASAVALPVPSGLPVICTGNDSNSNIDVWQLDTLVYGSSVHATLINAMSSYGGASTTNVPAGWNGNCTTGDSRADCSWKSREQLARGGCIYLPTERQVTSGTATIHDATIIKSCDGGVTWINPYTLTHSGIPNANGDAPLAPGDASYPGSIMWLMAADGSNRAAIYNWSFIQYGQDGSLPSVNPGGLTDPASYACAIMGDGSLGCVPNASIMDVTTWRYYSGRIIGATIPDINNIANWSSFFNTFSSTSITPSIASKVFTIPAGLTGLANGTRVYIHSTSTDAYMEGLITDYTGTSLTVNVDAILDSAAARTDWVIQTRTRLFQVANAGDNIQITQELSAPVYINELKSFLMVGYFSAPVGVNTAAFMQAPHEWGPWTPVYNHSVSIPCGFSTIAPGLNYIVVSVNPIIIRLTTVMYGSGGCGTPYTWNFQQWEFTEGKQPYGNGEVSSYIDIGLRKLNSGWVFGSGETPGTFNKNGLIWAFDFMDHGGDTTAKYPYFHDIINRTTIMIPCAGNSFVCGPPFGGVTYDTNGISITDGALGRLETRTNEINTSGGTPNQNAPSVFLGNGTFTVAGIFKINATLTQTGWVWATGNSSATGNAGGNQAIALVIRSGVNNYLQVWWGGGPVCEYAYQGTFKPIVGNWYFISLVIISGSPNPAAKLWTGIGGVLVDELNGISRTPVCGSPTQIPNVVAGPLRIGWDGASPNVLSGSYAGLFIYNKALSKFENDQLYQTLKLRMLDRSITIQ